MQEKHTSIIILSEKDKKLMRGWIDKKELAEILERTPKYEQPLIPIHLPHDPSFDISKAIYLAEYRWTK